MSLDSARALRSVGLRAFGLRLTSPMQTAHGEIAQRAGWMIRLEDSRGFVGLGEATPLPGFGTETFPVCENVLRACARNLIDLGAGFEKQAANRVIERHAAAAPCARAALDCAIADLEAESQSLGLSAYWRKQAGLEGAPSPSVEVQALIGGATPESVAAAATRAVEQGFRVFKLKLAVCVTSRELGSDLDRIAALREIVGSQAKLRLDANEAWSRDEALHALTSMSDFDIDYVEQPVARADLEGLAFLDREAPTRVAADEALLGEGLARCLESGAAKILIVKPAAIGGIRVAMDLVERANERGLRIIWSSLLDGAVSRQSALHLAAAIGPDVEVHGLGTGPLLADDFAGGAPLTDGTVSLPSCSGLGRFARLRSRDAFAESGGALWTIAADFLEAAR